MDDFNVFAEQHFLWPNGRREIIGRVKVMYGKRPMDFRRPETTEKIISYQKQGAQWREVIRIPQAPSTVVELAWATAVGFAPTYMWDEAECLIEAAANFAAELGLEIVPDGSYDFVAYGPGDPLPRTTGFTVVRKGMTDDGTSRTAYLSFAVQGAQNSEYCTRAKTCNIADLEDAMRQRFAE